MTGWYVVTKYIVSGVSSGAVDVSFVGCVFSGRRLVSFFDFR